MTITAEESCFHTAYLGITLIHFEGTFLTNIIARQLNGEMSTETIGHNHLNLSKIQLQNVTKFSSVPTVISLIQTNVLTSMLKRFSTNEVKSPLISSAYALAQQNASPALIRRAL